MLKQFPDHDYYFIDSFYPTLILMLISLMSFQFKKKWLNYSITIPLLFFLCLSFTETKTTLDKRFETGSWDRDEITRKTFTGTSVYLDSIGIAKDAKILVLDGYTTNVPLILMNRKGWTINWTTNDRIEEGLTKPFDLVAIQNCFVASDVVKNDSAIITQLEKFADNGFVSFYKMKRNEERTFYQFFGIDSSTILFREKKPDSIFAGVSNEFIELFSDSALKYISDKPVKILVTGRILRSEDAAPQLTGSVSKEEGVFYYFSFDLHDYTIKSDSPQNFMFQFVVPSRKNNSEILKVYFWNNQKGKFSLNDLRLVIYR